MIDSQLKDCLKTVLDSRLKTINWDEEKFKTSLEFTVPCCNPALSDEQTREDLKVTVKAMMCNADPEVIVDAIHRGTMILPLTFTKDSESFYLVISLATSSMATRSMLETQIMVTHPLFKYCCINDLILNK